MISRNVIQLNVENFQLPYFPHAKEAISFSLSLNCFTKKKLVSKTQILLVFW